MVSYYIPNEEQLEKLKQLSHYLSKHHAEIVLDNEINNNQLVISLHKDNLLKFLEVLKINYGFQQLIDIIAVDYPSKAERFEVIYQLLNLNANLRITVKTLVAENDYIDSCAKLYTNSNWLEREVWDMFGVYFKNHDDLRRILTDFGFEGHPLRKDFPLVGFAEVYFDEISKTVSYKSVELDAEYKNYNYQNPWIKGVENDSLNFLQINKENIKK